jgi:hypothetical protein
LRLYNYRCYIILYFDPVFEFIQDVKDFINNLQALAGDTQLPKLMETLMTIALENAGVDSDFLILSHKSGYRVEVAATAGATGVGV